VEVVEAVVALEAQAQEVDHHHLVDQVEADQGQLEQPLPGRQLPPTAIGMQVR